MSGGSMEYMFMWTPYRLIDQGEWMLDKTIRWLDEYNMPEKYGGTIAMLLTLKKQIAKWNGEIEDTQEIYKLFLRELEWMLSGDSSGKELDKETELLKDKLGIALYYHTNFQRRTFIDEEEIPQDVLDNEFEWIGREASRHGWILYYGKYYHLSQFKWHNHPFWDGMYLTPSKTKIVIKLLGNDQYMIGRSTVIDRMVENS